MNVHPKPIVVDPHALAKLRRSRVPVTRLRTSTCEN